MFTSQELDFLFSLGFVAREKDTLVLNKAITQMSVTIQDDGLIVLAVKGLTFFKTFEFKNFYRFIHHVLSILEGVEEAVLVLK